MPAWEDHGVSTVANEVQVRRRRLSELRARTQRGRRGWGVTFSGLLERVAKAAHALNEARCIFMRRLGESVRSDKHYPST